MEKKSLSGLPDMNSLLEHADLAAFSRERIKRAARSLLNSLRTDLTSGAIDNIPDANECAARILDLLERDKTPGLRRVINATGVLLHTNLGRAPLGTEAYASAKQIYCGYSNLEFDLETGRRSSRYEHVEKLIFEMTGAENAIVVNNNAAAVFLILAALAKDKRVAVSRGELVEIGGSFRIPEIMEHSGALLYEVGTTNKTRLGDYAAAADNGASALMKVHTSNYEIVGFTESVAIDELAVLGHARKLPVIYDMGSCFLTEPELLGLSAGESARSAIEAGADIICFSGDKLAGMTQAGIVAGRFEYIEMIKKHPLSRMVRPDKLTLSAIETTLRLYRYPKDAISRIPVLSMLSAAPEELFDRAKSLCERIRAACSDWDVDIREIADEAGGGSLPNLPLSGFAVTIKPSNMSAAALERQLRCGEIPVCTRISENTVLISIRTLLPGDENDVVSAVTVLHSNVKAQL